MKNKSLFSAIFTKIFFFTIILLGVGCSSYKPIFFDPQKSEYNFYELNAKYKIPSGFRPVTDQDRREDPFLKYLKLDNLYFGSKKAHLYPIIHATKKIVLVLGLVD